MFRKMQFIQFTITFCRKSAFILMLVCVNLTPSVGIKDILASELTTNIGIKDNMDTVLEDAECVIYCHVTKMNVKEYHANCSYRNLTEIPNISRYNITASNITSLDLVGNFFKNLSSVSWEEFTSLRNLSLARNQIDILEDGNFENLSKLEVLDLSLNHIRYNDIGKNVFEPLKSLLYLDLKQTLTEVRENETYPAALQQLPELKVLMIDGLYDKDLPHMPTLTELYLSGEYGRCNITNLNQTYFSHVENVQRLFISNCSIAKIFKNTFGNLTNLTSLDLARNTLLGIEAVPNITYGLNITKTIKQLNLNSLYDYINYDLCSSLEVDDVKYLTNTSLELLTLEKNYIVRMADTAVDYFPWTLRYLSISDNMFMYGKYVTHMFKKSTLHNLVYFDASKMYKTHLPIKTVSSSQVDSAIEMKLLESSTSIQGSCNATAGTFEALCNSMLTRLKVIDDFEVIRNKMKKYNISARYRTTKNSILEYLDLSENLPGTFQMSLELFNNTPDMKFLNVSNNYLGFPLLEDGNYTVFQSVQNLHTLDISNNRITELMQTVFVNLTKLEKLYLTNNRLTNLSFDLTPLKELKYLDLSNNRLENIHKKARESLDKLKDIRINLAFNSLLCTCKDIHFVTWLQKNALKLVETNCNFDNHTTVPISKLNFDQFHFECSPPEYHAIILAVSLCILAFIIIVSCGLVYRFKWNLRYLYYMTKFKLAGGYQPIDDREYDKDVFVSYANEDRGFVRQHVVKELETDGNISLLVHDRDFRAGEFVADNIMQAITSTRRTLVILSAAYIRSKWCMYELNMARMEAADTGRNVLCVIIKEDIPVKYLPIEVIDIIKKKTYMEFPTEEEDMDLFWNRLRATLNHEM